MITETTSLKYCNSLTSYSRFKTREVYIGDIPLGGNNPIRIQSMTTTDTMDTVATVEQSIRIINAGADYVRITAPSIKEAKNLENIKNELRKQGYKTPLIADIHFTPNAAELAARIVEKVRVNPGNYADKKKFQIYNYTDNLYEAELERIREKFTPLVLICKEYGTAMRIGTNHGSLSDRIMSRYGDTPLGMVESALEFLRICEDNNYYNIVLSMKASNPKVMVEAYRLLVNKMIDENMNYPLHLGVTEAGEGEDGRIKSAVGIGTLLEDGLGDTIRVSLTEDPEFEIPVCKDLVERYVNRSNSKIIPDIESLNFNPFEFNKRESLGILNTGGHNVPRVILSLRNISDFKEFKKIGYDYIPELDKWNINDIAPDYLYLGNKNIDFKLPGTLGKIFDLEFFNSLEDKENSYPLMLVDELKNYKFNSPAFIELSLDELTEENLEILKSKQNIILVVNTENENAYSELRALFLILKNENIKLPVIIKRSYTLNEDKFMLYSSIDAGGLLLDGFGDGVWFDSINKQVSESVINSVSFGILQATRTRISKTEYISCPSCGRTLFDLQETTAMIRNKTNHLKGVKIAIMGCIVNGPGEMADADYGYVGSGPGKITLYKGKEVVKRSINSELALDKLIELIKENGDWVEL
ncbi:MAG TPA: (E)-4-hydroxy-3-methylbut-2-enyl-diphosphate synthase [Ignavibacteria bacterium]|nr:(E)-4-hydroxy-3-methylbut-2-enyl-diphosphate synthase [Ignavibacteria bacterium]